jgi:hypothetical protein
MLRVAGVIFKARWQAGDDSDMQEDSFALMFLHSRALLHATRGRCMARASIVATTVA